jgi:hypothetical protein
MRPKNIVMVVADDADELGVLRNFLYVRGFDGRGFLSIDEAFDAVQAEEPKALVLTASAARGKADLYIEVLRWIAPRVSVVIYGVREGEFAETIALKSPANNMVFLERLRVACARKRGPKKRVVSTIEPELYELPRAV